MEEKVLIKHQIKLIGQKFEDKGEIEVLDLSHKICKLFLSE